MVKLIFFHYMDVYVITFFTFFLFIFFFQITADAGEHHIQLFSLTDENNATNIFYIGETEVEIRVDFYDNCSIYSIKTSECVIFKDILNLSNWDSAVGNSSSIFSLELNPSKEIGEYQFSIFLTYSNDTTQNNTKTFNFNILYQKAFEIIKIIRPRNDWLYLQLTIRNYLNNMSLNISFDADGDISIYPESYAEENLKTGDYDFKSKITKISNEYTVGRHLSYGIIAKFNNRRIEVYSENIEFSNPSNDYNNINGPMKIYLIILIILFLIIINYIYFIKKK